MILIGYSCPHCGGNVLDSLDHCHRCLKPYEGQLAAVAKAHHEAKLAMVANSSGRSVTEKEMLDGVERLAAVTQGLAATEKSGQKVPEQLIPELFQEIRDE